MQIKLWKKMLRSMQIAILMAGALLMLRNMTVVHAQDILSGPIDEQRDDGTKLYAFRYDGNFSVYLETLRENVTLKEGSHINYDIYVIKWNQEEKAQSAQITFTLPDILKYINAEEITEFGQPLNVNNDIGYNESNKTLTWKINSFQETPHLKVEAEVGKLKDGEYTKSAECKAILEYDDKKIETKNLECKVAKSNLLITTEIENFNQVNKMGDEIIFNINIKNQNDAEDKTDIKLSLPNEMEIIQTGSSYGFIISDKKREIQGKDIMIAPNESMTLKVGAKINYFDIPNTEKNIVLNIKAEINGEEAKLNVVVENPNYDEQQASDTIMYIILGLVVAIMLAIGIYMIKRKVLNK